MPYKDPEKQKAYVTAWMKTHLEDGAYYEKRKKRMRLYARSHKEEQLENARRRRKENPEKARAKGRANAKRWREKNYEKLREYKRKNDLLRNPVMHMLNGGVKVLSCRKYVGCSPGFLRNHLESLFQPGMTWDNYGRWHIDHIVPLSWFPCDKDSSLLFVASHWTNLRPMWARDNMAKGNRHAA